VREGGSARERAKERDSQRKREEQLQNKTDVCASRTNIGVCVCVCVCCSFFYINTDVWEGPCSRGVLVFDVERACVCAAVNEKEGNNKQHDGQGMRQQRAAVCARKDCPEQGVGAAGHGRLDVKSTTESSSKYYLPSPSQQASQPASQPALRLPTTFESNEETERARGGERRGWRCGRERGQKSLSSDNQQQGRTSSNYANCKREWQERVEANDETGLPHMDFIRWLGSSVFFLSSWRTQGSSRGNIAV
jgi:hypothetical protein